MFHQVTRYQFNIRRFKNWLTVSHRFISLLYITLYKESGYAWQISMVRAVIRFVLHEIPFDLETFMIYYYIIDIHAASLFAPAIGILRWFAFKESS